MRDRPLGIRHLFEPGRTIHADSEVITWTGTGPTTAGFAHVADRADRLANVLRHLWSNRVIGSGTYCRRNQHHLEAYMAVPCMGAVLHTLNSRPFPDQLPMSSNTPRTRSSSSPSR